MMKTSHSKLVVSRDFLNLIREMCAHARTRTRMKLNPPVTLYTKINSEWIQDRHIRPETVKVLQDYVGQVFYHLTSWK